MMYLNILLSAIHPIGECEYSLVYFWARFCGSIKAAVEPVHSPPTDLEIFYHRLLLHPVLFLSLRFDSTDLWILQWIQRDPGPFDFSRLTALSITTVSVLRWPRMAPVLQTIQIHEFDYDVCLPSAFEITLAQILCMESATDALPTLTASSGIRQIVAAISFQSPQINRCGRLDSCVANLALQHLPTVGLEMDAEQYAHYLPEFPQLNSKNLVTVLLIFLNHLHRLIRA
ncbi:hypothetical protein K438DRAFT_786680 [Mycena galopus ATCC 62051]|nr:hypothetical protein K438DRAFT_786680 [Mycena galopus ATCC 62051]